MPETLAARARALSSAKLGDLLVRDPERATRLALQWGEWRIDFSKERVDAATLEALVAHADAIGVPRWIDALFAGERVNLSESRPALHTALRQQDDTPGARRRPGRDPVDPGSAAAHQGDRRRDPRGTASRRDRQADHRRRQHRHRRLRPRAAHGLRRPRRHRRAARARVVRVQRRSGGDRAGAGAARSGVDRVRRHLEDVHDAGDARQRDRGARLARACAPRSRARHALRRRLRERRRRPGHSASPPTTCCRCGTGSAAAIRCGRRWACRSRSVAVPMRSMHCSRVLPRWTRTCAPRRSRRTPPSCSRWSAGGTRAGSATRSGW